MVNTKRVEQKIPLLISEGSWPRLTAELDRNEYRVSKFKKRERQAYNQHLNSLVKTLDNLQKDVNRSFSQSKSRR